MIDTPAWHRGERKCEACSPKRDAFMHFGQYKGWWHVSFSLLPGQKPLARKLTFRDKEKRFELARRTGAPEPIGAHQ